MRKLSSFLFVFFIVFNFGLSLSKTAFALNEPELVKDINQIGKNSTPNYLTLVENTLYFSAIKDDFGTELWKSDGTEAGTVLVKDILPGSNGSSPYNLAAIDGTLYFSANDGINGVELWKSDGTEAGTVLVKDIRIGSMSSSIQYLTAIGNILYFQANDGINGVELWKSDGTEAGTIIVKDINPGSANGSQSKLTAIGNTLYFSADDGTNGFELWKSDGTEAGTIMVKDIYPDSGSGIPQSLTIFDNTLYFSADNGTNGQELWKSDGTEAGTIMVKDIVPGSGNTSLINFSVGGDTLYFSANNGTNGQELWKSDGTEAGTIMVKDIFPGSDGSTPYSLTAIDGTLYFGSNDGTNGFELWKSDGTDVGTVMVKDIYPGYGDGSLSNLTVIENTLYFSANNGTNGREFWKSDGTEAGTVLFKDINPSSGSSSTSYFTLIANTLYFNAVDGIHGSELWKLSIDLTPPLGSININSGSAFTTSTNVSLNISATDEMSDVTQMIICNNPSFTGCTWEPYATTKDWTIVAVGRTPPPSTIYVKFKDAENNASISYFDIIQFHTLSIDITEIGLVGDVIDTNPMTYTLNSNVQEIKGQIGTGNTIFFIYGGQTYSTIADSLGDFSITLILNEGLNEVQYYVKDISNNQSEIQTMNLIVVPEVAQPAPTTSPPTRWTLPNTGEQDLEQTPTVSLTITITETPKITLRPSFTPTPKPSSEEQKDDVYLYIGPIKIKKTDIQAAEVLSESVSNAGAVAMLVVAPISLMIIPQIFSKGFLWYLPPKKRKPWGVIYDIENRKPIAFAIVRILNGTGKVLKETVSDLKGRYDFILDPGTYTMEIETGSFAKYTSQVNIRSTDEQHTEDVGLVKGSGASRFMLKEKLYYVYLYTFWTIGTIGLIFSGISLVLGFDVINLLILIFYAVQIYFLLKTRKPQNWGYVFDTITDERLTGVFVRVLGITDGRQLNVILTDEKGRFSLRLDEGDYLLKTDMPGYTLSDSGQHIQTLPTGDKVTKISSNDLKNGVELGLVKG